MPLALLAAMPPIIAESIDAGSGPILHPNCARWWFAAAPITPGCNVIVAASAPISQLAPVVTEQHQHRIGDRLPRKTRAGGSESDRRSELRARGEQPDHFLFALDDHCELRDQPIEARVGSPGQQTQRIGDQALVGNEFRQETMERIVRRTQRMRVRAMPRRNGRQREHAPYRVLVNARRAP